MHMHNTKNVLWVLNVYLSHFSASESCLGLDEKWYHSQK